MKHGSFYCHAEIAQGGQGTVYLGTGDDQALSRLCVIKTFSESDRDTIARAGRSIRTQLGLLDEASIGQHPCIRAMTRSDQPLGFPTSSHGI